MSEWQKWILRRNYTSQGNGNYSARRIYAISGFGSIERYFITPLNVFINLHGKILLVKLNGLSAGVNSGIIQLILLRYLDSSSYQSCNYVAVLSDTNVNLFFKNYSILVIREKKFCIQLAKSFLSCTWLQICPREKFKVCENPLYYIYILCIFIVQLYSSVISLIRREMLIIKFK